LNSDGICRGCRGSAPVPAPFDLWERKGQPQGVCPYRTLLTEVDMRSSVAKIYILAAIINSAWILGAIVPLVSSYELRDFSEFKLAVYLKFVFVWIAVLLSAWGGYRLSQTWNREKAIAKLVKSAIVLTGVAILLPNAVLLLFFFSAILVYRRIIFFSIFGWLFVWSILVLTNKFDRWFAIGSGILAAILIILLSGFAYLDLVPTTSVTKIASPSGEKAVYLERRYANYYFNATCQFQIYIYRLGILQRSIAPDRPPWQKNRCWDYSNVIVEWNEDEDSIRWKAIGDRDSIPTQAGTISLNNSIAD